MPKLLRAPAIRDMRRGDLSRVMEIERATFSSEAWEAKDYRGFHSQEHVRCLVVERDGRVVGSMVYAIFRRHFNLWSIAVDPDYQRRGIGSELIDLLRAKLAPRQRREIRTLVSEWDTPAQHFFASQGFKATEVRRGELETQRGREDAYAFVLGRRSR